MEPSVMLHCKAVIGDMPEDALRIQKFVLEDSISQCYTLDISALCSKSDVPYDNLIGKSVTLTVHGGDFPTRHHGVLVAYRQFPDQGEIFDSEHHLYTFKVKPRLSLLEYTTQSRVFQKKSLAGILEEVFQEAGLQAKDYQLDLTGTFPNREFTVQYNETDLNFVERLLEEEGVAYFFQQGEKSEVAVFTDSPRAFRPLPNTPVLPFQPVNGLSHLAVDHVTSISRYQHMVTGKAARKDYNDRTPEVTIHGKEAGKGQGEDYGYGPHARNPEDASKLARLAAERNACHKMILEGEGGCRDIRAGYRFELSDSSGSTFAGHYTVVKCTHDGDNRQGFEGESLTMDYKTTFTCIPADILFRPPLRATKPSVPGIMVARVDGVAGPYAYLDDDGRYKVKMPFDRTDRKDGQASLPVRLSQPYSGPGYGMHFPNHISNDMVLAFINGDIDRPMALGTVPNPMQSSPVAAKNHSESIIKTASGHQMRMDDLAGKTVVDIETSGKHFFSMDDAPDTKGISLSTHGEHVVHMDDKGTKILIRSKYGHEVVLDDGSKTITIRTPEGHSLVMDDPAKTITMQDCDSKTRLHMDGSMGNIDMTASNSITIAAGVSINILAGKNIMTTSGANTDMMVGDNFSLIAKNNVKVEAGKSAEMRAKDDFSLESGKKLRAVSTKTSVEASDTLNIKGKKVLSDADTDYKVTAGKAHIKASGDIVMAGAKIKQN